MIAYRLPLPRRALARPGRAGLSSAKLCVAARVLSAACHVLDRGVPFHELGEEFCYRRDTEIRAADVLTVFPQAVDDVDAYGGVARALRLTGPRPSVHLP